MAMKKKVVILSGAGVSAESGLKTFRDSDGLWNEYKLEDVCTVKAWANNPTLVNDFYNMRRIEALKAEPNRAHLAIAEAEEDFEVVVVTTNVDTLHEAAGSTNVLHLHGNLSKARSSRNSLGSLDDYLLEKFLVDVGKEGIKPYQEASDGHLLRPHVVFFGESVPNLPTAIEHVKEADALIIVGTSLQVYPAASLVFDTKKDCKVFYVDPTRDVDAAYSFPCRFINDKATVGVPVALNQIKEMFDV